MLEDVCICIQSYNRYWMLKLMKHYLEDIWSNVIIFDDGSTDDRIWSEFSDSIVYSAESHDPVDEKEANKRCGAQRKKIVDYFLEKTNKNYLLWMDDDIIVNSYTLYDGLNDFKCLYRFSKDARTNSTLRGIGLYSFHTWMRDALRFEFKKNIYGVFSLTGESCCIQSRDVLIKFGNNYGPHVGGYLDTHVAALKKNGYHIICRLTNPLPVQHIGVGNTSFIHPDHNLKYWHKDLWHSYETKEHLRPKGFNPSIYLNLVETYGAKDAPEAYYKIIKKEKVDMKKKDKRSDISDLKDGIRDINGELEIKVHRGTKDGEVVRTEKFKNVVVDNATVVIAHLLAGNNMSNYYISKMQFGTGTTAATTSDTTLESAISPIKSISTYSYPTSKSVKFTAYLLEDEANGFAITEAGLLSNNASPALVARRVFGAINKTDDWVIELNWTLYWS